MRTVLLFVSLLLAIGCASPEAEPELGTVQSAMAAPDAAEQEPTTADGPLVLSTTEDPLPADLPLTQPWNGDFDGMVERRVIRAVVAVSMTQYFLDGATQRGITYDALQQFEKAINEKLKTGNLKVHVAIIPVARDQLLAAVADGRADIAAANLTITPERRQLVDFSIPAFTGVREIVVTGPQSPALQQLHDLAGHSIHVRQSSSYYESLTKLNEELKEAGKEEIELVLADEHLEDEDLLQMVNAGLLPLAVVDSTKAEFWAEIFGNLELHPDLAVRTDGEIAWAFRPGSPKFAAEVNAFVKANRKGTLMGRVSRRPWRSWR